MHVSAVIGASYGDEGKGHIVDWLCQEEKKALVVRFNGGAQAGHTVVTPDRHRHVFHHFGSGTFRGAATYFANRFLVNPALFMQEYQELKKLGLEPVCYADPFCRVTTPWDMALNQEVERWRDQERHGSCGVGIYETVERSRDPGYNLMYQDLFSIEYVRDMLKKIREEWVPKRLKLLGAPETLLYRFDANALDEHFLSDVLAMTTRVRKKVSLHRAEAEWDHIVFEGAQGLRLDQEAPGFPFLTCSKTGIPNVAIAMAGHQEPIDVYYVTRTYLTRHGPGPLSHELPSRPRESMKDDTNVRNDWQGHLRYAWLNVNELSEPILKDLSWAKEHGLRVTPHLAITCLDQTPSWITWHNGGLEHYSSADLLIRQMKTATHIERVVASYGLTSNEVHRYEE